MADVDMWLSYAKQGYRKFKSYIDNTVLPSLLRKSHFEGFNKRQIKDAINWHYFQQVPKTTSHLLNSLIKIHTEISFELPFFKTIELLTASSVEQDQNVVFSEYGVSSPVEHRRAAADETRSTLEREKNSNLFVYVFHHSNSMDMRRTINYFGGELLFAFVVESFYNLVDSIPGAQHSSDLPFLFGPSMFKQISRRKLSQTEEKLCKKFKQLFGDFVKTG